MIWLQIILYLVEMVEAIILITFNACAIHAMLENQD